jgi:hypothetical protein
MLVSRPSAHNHRMPLCIQVGALILLMATRSATATSSASGGVHASSQQASGLDVFLAALVAVFVGSAAVVIDCLYVSESEKSPYVTLPLWQSWVAWFFCLGFGLVPGAALLWTTVSNSSVVGRIVGLEQSDIFARALACGLTVTLLIRSKIFHVGKGRTAVGMDLVYEWLQKKLFRELRHRMELKKNRVINEQITLVIRNSTLSILPQICRSILSEEKELLEGYNRQLANLEKRCPEHPGSDYFEAHARLAADFIGIDRVAQHLKNIPS